MEQCIKIRRYKPSDCRHLADLFYQTVHTINVKDYTDQQLQAWATGTIDLGKWNQSFLEHYTLIATLDNQIVGFGDIDSTGYLDRLYVHKDYQGQGIATIICNHLEQAIDTKQITTHASITAKNFFEQRGYKTLQQQTVIRNNIALTNFIMKKIKQKE